MYKDIKEIFETETGKKARSIKKIEGGFNNDNYLINDAYILRLLKENEDETIDHTKEAEIYKNILTSFPLAEKIVFFSEDGAIKISRFIHGSRPYKDSLDETQILSIVRALKKLRKNDYQTSQHYDAIGKLETYKRTLNKDEEIDQTLEMKTKEEFAKILSKDSEIFSHNDLVRGNMLFSFNGVKLIDREYASMNSSYFDIASIISENGLNLQQKEYFLKKFYGTKLNLSLRKKIGITILFQDILFYYRANYMFLKRKDSIYQKIKDDKRKRIASDRISVDL
jgi:thiamine kinase-like enzyme